MSKIFINPGHSPRWEIDAGITATEPEPGACCFGLQENIIAASAGALLEKECLKYGIGIAGNLQSSSLYEITDAANATDADILVSIHCNAAGSAAKDTETFYLVKSVYLILVGKLPSTYGKLESEKAKSLYRIEQSEGKP